MTEQEYVDRHNAIERKTQLAYRNLIIECALSNAIFHEGDIIQNNQHILLIQKVTAYKGLGWPEPCYQGIELKKDLTSFKKKTVGAIYGNEGVELIKSVFPIKSKRRSK